VAIKIKDPNYDSYTIQFGTILWSKKTALWLYGFQEIGTLKKIKRSL
jgi:hypothetical protein